MELAKETEAELFKIRKGKSLGNGGQPLQRIASGITVRFCIGQ